MYEDWKATSDAPKRSNPIEIQTKVETIIEMDKYSVSYFLYIL